MEENLGEERKRAKVAVARAAKKRPRKGDARDQKAVI
jgi:hypothetical protein